MASNHRINSRFLLNLIAIVGLLAGGLLSFLPGTNVPPELQGALWGGLLAWLAAVRSNGTPSNPTP